MFHFLHERVNSVSRMLSHNLKMAFEQCKLIEIGGTGRTAFCLKVFLVMVKFINPVSFVPCLNVHQMPFENGFILHCNANKFVNTARLPGLRPLVSPAGAFPSGPNQIP